MNFLWKSQKTVEVDAVFIGEQRLEKVEIQQYLYNEETLTVDANITSLDSSLFDHKERANWVNFHGIHDEALIIQICNILNFDTLMSQDILDTNQRPKLRDVEDYIFISLKSILPSKNKTIKLEQISFVLGPNFICSFQEMKSDHFQHIRQRLSEKKGKVRRKREDYLLYLLLESIIDNYFQTIHKLWPEIEALQSLTAGRDANKHIEDIENLRAIFNTMKKSLSPLKDALAKLTKLDVSFIAKENFKYFEDNKDQCSYLLDEVEFILQRLESAMNISFAYQSHKMNEVMKTLTMVSTIFIPITFLAGIYGMNFEFMPELKFKYAYPVLVAIMLGISGISLFYFKRKKWF